MQGFMFNLRRPLFQDRRVRRAINLAFDFPWSNNHLFYGQYRRCTSYFSNSELAARGGPPKGKVREILDKHRDVLPSGVFGPKERPPTTSGETTLRDNLLQARELLRDAGWKVGPDGVLRNEDGDAFRFEFLLAQEGFERILAPFFRNLERLGMRPEYRTVDASLYQQRVRSFNFDMAVMSFPQSQSPGNELRSMFHSDNADRQGSRNYMGISDAGVDALIDEVIYARDRDQLIAAARALDRALMHGSYLVPNWYIDAHRVAYRDWLAMPETEPLYYQAETWVLESWWEGQR
jgi:microcin C transport system substrate-binding protein